MRYANGQTQSRDSRDIQKHTQYSTDYYYIYQETQQIKTGFRETEKITKKTSETTEIIVFFSETPEITK